jgi:hypothetical protein
MVFDVVFSTGTVKKEIYCMERIRLINGLKDGNGRISSIASKGEKARFYKHLRLGWLVD